MVTVIATGFDGGRKRHSTSREATGVMDTSVSGRQPRERDFLEELQRQRDEVIPSVDRSDDDGGPGRERPAGRAIGRGAGAAQARHDLRRRRPGDPKLPSPEVTVRW